MIVALETHEATRISNYIKYKVKCTRTKLRKSGEFEKVKSRLSLSSIHPNLNILVPELVDEDSDGVEGVVGRRGRVHGRHHVKGNER